ncbi:RT0821/Lpp0805 family surface protein [Azospirillum sp. TSO22-1]|uniref:RT0821/Lpp0805 family surface protein n=1 Tax=Azospirillum sp. TSO22-1 TaxID=716789 RepID=UPI000D64CBD7|nr:RT0821/Lpp0805 family surface protein [Azospirillum sp. TSO22-1]
MKTLTRSTAAALGVAILLSGCAQPGPYGSAAPGTGIDGFGANKATAGTVLGGVVGGLAGSRFGGGSGKLVAVGVGTLLGAALGNMAGKSLDRADQAYVQRAEQQAYAAPMGETIRWNNPQTGNSGTYTPVRDGYAPSGQYCREYQTTVVIGGQPQNASGVACQQPDGSWRIQG